MKNIHIPQNTGWLQNIGWKQTRALALSVSLAASMLAPATFAQEIDADHLVAARKALTASTASASFDRILPALANRIKTQRISARPDLSDQISTIVDTKALELAARRGDLEKEAATIYAKVFSKEELEAIRAFYTSEAGQKFLSEAPIVSRQMREASQIWAGGLTRDMAKAVADEMKKQNLE